MVPGQLRNNWQNTLNANTTLPRQRFPVFDCTKPLFLPLPAYSNDSSYFVPF